MIRMQFTNDLHSGGYITLYYERAIISQSEALCELYISNPYGISYDSMVSTTNCALPSQTP